MAPKTGIVPINPQEQWVSTTWMPHTTLSQSSHVCLTIRSAHAVLGSMDYSTCLPEWRVRIGVYGIGGLPLVPIQTQTTAAPVEAKRTLLQQHGSGDDNYVNAEAKEEIHPRVTVSKATHDCQWDSFVHVPIRWRDLPRDAYLLLEVLGQRDTVEYQTTMPFFSQYGKLFTGLQKLELSMHPLDPNKNHGLVPFGTRHRDDDNDDPVWTAVQTLDKLERMEQRARTNPASAIGETAFGEIPSVPWLDAMQKERAKGIISDTIAQGIDPLLFDDTRASLIVELPMFDIPIMHEDTFNPVPQGGASGAVAPVDLAAYRKRSEQGKRNEGGGGTIPFDPLQLVPFLDYENETDNPVEDKYRTLAHDLLRGLVDPALKPGREQRNRLAHIIDSPSHHPTREEKDLLWRFRFSLVDNRRALTKFLLAVDWSVESEQVQAAELLEQWRKRSPIEVTDALKLLGKHVAFQTNLVRDYAIDTLAAAPDSELRLYLLQLVQALKYENVQVGAAAQVSSLATFLINRAAGNLELANYLYWYLKVELEDATYGARYREVFTALKARLSKTSFSMSGLHEFHTDDSATPFKSIVESVSKLGSSLRKVENPVSERERKAKKSAKLRSLWDVLTEQDNFISGVLDIQMRCRDSRGKKDAKEAELKSLLSKEGFDRKQDRDPVPLPSRPDVFVNGVRPESAAMFKSALYPALLECHVEGTMDSGKPSPSMGGDDASKPGKSRVGTIEERMVSYKVIVKTGDDLRQDQLIIMMIQLMDRLLKRAALDLCLTPYSIIATSPTSGLVEFVDGSVPISQVLSKFNGSILQFLQSASPQKGAKYDIRADVMSTYLRSCAGYCVITYILGVGDRHLDNILLRASGHLFHIDFGFIFGRDPKPLPPLFRLTREMVDGMGGTDSSEYRQFCSLACQAFNALRKSAGLVLNLLHLMSDAGIEDLSNNPSANTEGVLAKVEERFRLDLTDEQAERYFIGLINDCLAAIAPRVMDVFHSIVVSRR